MQLILQFLDVGSTSTSFTIHVYIQLDLHLDIQRVSGGRVGHVVDSMGADQGGVGKELEVGIAGSLVAERGVLATVWVLTKGGEWSAGSSRLGRWSVPMSKDLNGGRRSPWCCWI